MSKNIKFKAESNDRYIIKQKEKTYNKLSVITLLFQLLPAILLFKFGHGDGFELLVYMIFILPMYYILVIIGLICTLIKSKNEINVYYILIIFSSIGLSIYFNGIMISDIMKLGTFIVWFCFIFYLLFLISLFFSEDQ